ncbi:uncharacterized protein LOC120260030 [Dioscorea cayenensis subsp. rotundata]|uniref:Uncharacterized protein LOC120260030 n=1 Tax=Dioscorea cayennensis subsp. rotundata TaxID=55577 RepID=A0AB40B823_DIOCR|nr:uncharacterized protein LOC120260030 [Dioscorea cayenensis subsp. rotundata]
MCHRRWLEPNHRLRNDEQSFDGSCELRSAPIPPSGSNILRQLEVLDTIEDGPWKKKSILFSLPYWEHLCLRHNQDVMHIEKNVSDNILGSLIGQEGKSKDKYKARLDLEDMGIRSVLHPKDRLGSSTKYLPKSCYQMTSSEKDAFLKVLKEMKIPDEYSCNLSRCVKLKQWKIIRMKSYDCQLLIQEFLPISIRGSLPNNVASVRIDLCYFFKELCSMVLNEHDIETLDSQVVTLLCEMEKNYPPSFFTIMVHLLIHLPSEVKIAGPVIYRWMCPIERFLLVLKSFVGNRAHPKGSIAEGYLAQECLTFCSLYLVGVVMKYNRPTRNYEGNENLTDSQEDSIFKTQGCPLGKKRQQGFYVKKRKRVKRVTLDKQTLEQAHRYALFNCDEVAPFREEHKDLLRKRNRASRLSPYEMDKLHCRIFNEWFRNRVAHLIDQGSTIITDHIKCLARIPEEVARRYTGYLINGYRFHTKEREKFLKTQNSGVVVTAKAMSYATTRDKQPIEREVNYFGALTEIIQLQYSGGYNVVLFKCDWIDINRGCKKDKFGHLTHKGDDILDDPFVLASQVKKAFYIKDERHRDWLVVKHVRRRDVFDMDDEWSFEKQQFDREVHAKNVISTCDTSNWVRNEVDDDGVDVTQKMENEEVQDELVDEHDGEDVF